MDPLSPALVGVLGLVLTFLLVGMLVLSRYKVASPNEAIIVSGRKGDGDVPQKVITGGTFVWPVVQQAHRLDLSARRISVAVRGAVSKQGIRLNVEGVAVVRVNGEDEGSIRAAAARYLTQQSKIGEDTTEVLAGALRAIVGTMTVDEILRDRAAFASQVADVTESSLTGSGLMLDTFQIQDVIDEGYGAGPGAYLRDLERPEAARAAQEATIAEAEARRVSEQRRLEAEQAILVSQRELALQQAATSAETEAARARAAAAGPLAQAEREQDLLRERQKVAVQQAELTDRNLDAQVRKPADAQAYKLEVEAEAQRRAAVLEAEARKAATIAAAEAQARQDELTGVGEQRRRAALAEAVRAEGAAQAEAAGAVGDAEAHVLHAKADAYARFNQAAVLDMLINVVPQVAKELAAPMGAIDNLTVVSSEGATALSRSVTDNFTQLQALLKEAVGIDLAGLVSSFTGHQHAVVEGGPVQVVPVAATE